MLPNERECPTCPMVFDAADLAAHVCVGYDDHPEAWPDDDKRLRGTTVWPRPEER